MVGKIRHLTARTLGKLSRVADGVDAAPPIDISDEYVNWLCYANAGMLNRGNLYCFDYAIRNLPSEAPIIEIGSFCGLSANILSYYKRKYGKRNVLLTCDRWQFENAHEGGSVGSSQVSHSEYREFVKQSYVRNVRMFSRDDLPYTIESLSDDFFNSWGNSDKRFDVFGREVQLGGSFSFCYLDGNHSYEYVRRDFENCDKYLEPGGFILFDDSQDGSIWEVCRVVQEVRDSKKYDLVIKNPNYLFQKK